MNLSAFSKILKKYEKITSRRAARSYMKIVDNSYIGSSDEVSALMDRVKVTFIKHFSNSNRREGMKLLRPKQRREKHRITFFSGFFSGCSFALLIAVILLLEDRKLTDKENTTSYLGNIFPLYSFYAYIVLHVLVYAADIYFWRRYKINYPFIFGFEQGTELSYREVFLISNGLAMLTLGTFLVHLYIKMDSRKQDYMTCFDFLPLGLLIVVLFIVLCPFSILYHSSRFFLIKCVFHCICAPLYEVTLPDFFLADQLTSQVQAIRSLEYYICFYTWKESSWRRTKCSNHDAYNIFYFIVAVFPYWFRFLQILGLEEHLATLKIIHIAGTKGKGSTCTFCEAILRECGFRTGMFTSPHLIDVRERFRLDGLDIAEDKFLHYFWECWNQLKENVTDDLPMPPLFQFLTVLAFKIFCSEKVEVAIIEVGIGGTNDSTNVIKDPVVCGISPLGMDHIETLGDTLGLIASHKAGIFKPQVPAFTVPQLSEAMEVLEDRANGLMAPLEVATPLDCNKLNGVKLSLSGDHQFTNAGLAVALCKCWLQRTGNWEKQFQQASLEKEILPEAFLRGLSTARLSGRAQIVHDSSLNSSNMSGVSKGSSGDLIFYLDGAHSPESMEACARWYSTAVKGNNDTSSFSPSCSKFLTMEGVWGNGRASHGNSESNKIFKQILLFNCMDVRDPQILLPTLVNTCASSGTYFSKAIFVPSISKYSKVTSASSAIPLDSPSKDLTWQFNLQRVWEKIIHGNDVSDKSLHMKISQTFPSRKFIREDVSNCNPTDGHFACSVVVSSLPLTINWLRDCVKENSSLRIQVLVTGSLHLVGDVLKLLRR